MIDVTFKLNGADYSHLLSTYDVTYEIAYPAIVTAIDGTEYGFAQRRPTVSFTLIPLTDEQSAQFFTDLQSMDVLCEYTNPYTNSTSSASMRVMTNLQSAFGLRSIDGNRYYKGSEITLRQRTVL